MEVLWHFGVALRGEMSSRLNVALAEDRGGKRLRKRRRESRQAGIRKASESDPLMKRRKLRDDTKTGYVLNPGMSLAGARLLARRGPGGRGGEGDLRVLQGNGEGGGR